MNIVIAVDSFKGTISSIELSKLIANKFNHGKNNIKTFPISDGGEGFVDAIKTFYNIDSEHCYVPGPLLKETKAEYLLYDEVALVELNSASGIMLLKETELNPLKTTTYGFGLLIKNAIDKGAKKIVFGLGGSATNDGGAGMLQALGAKFYSNNELLKSPINGNDLGKITKIEFNDLIETIKDITFEVALDVSNPLLGEFGATHVFSAQKGANINQTKLLEKNMENYANIVEKTINKKIRDEKGTGAAGGVGFAARAVLNAKFVLGIDYIIDLFEIESVIKEADLVIVGEGRLDKQSKYGKAPLGIAKIAKKYNKKVIGLFGSKENVDVSEYIDEVYTVVPNYATQKESIKNPIINFKKMLDDIKL